MRIKRVTVIVAFDDDTSMSETIINPGPQGANSRFMARQFIDGSNAIDAVLLRQIEAKSPNQLPIERPKITNYPSIAEQVERHQEINEQRRKAGGWPSLP